MSSTEMEKLVDFALTRNDLGRLTEEVSRFLKNPIAVYDCGYYILSFSSLNDVEDPVWLEGMKRRYCRLEYAAHFTHLARTSSSDSQMINNFGDHRRRMSVLRMGKDIVGYYSIIENNVPFEEVPDEHYALAAKLLAKEVSHYYGLNNAFIVPAHHRIITDILNGQFANEELLNQRIAGTELDIRTKFRLVTIEMDNYTGKTAQLEGMSSYFRTLLPSSWANYFMHTIVVLLDVKSPHYNPPETIPQIAAYIQRLNMQGCISGEFDSLFQLKEQYNSTLEILDLAREIGVRKPLLSAEKFKLIRLISKIGADSISSVCSSAVLELNREDSVDDQNSLETVFLYLHFNKSLKKASEYLFVHRNTIAYRIQKTCEKYNINFEDEYQNTLYYLSCLMLFYHQPSLREKFKRFLEMLN